MLVEVRRERTRQHDKWGEQNHDDGWWTAILAEEVGEAAQAALQAHFPDDGSKTLDDLREELIQVAAVAVAWIEAIDRRPSGEHEHVIDGDFCSTCKERVRCAWCSNPYNEATDSWGACATCLADDPPRYVAIKGPM